MTTLSMQTRLYLTLIGANLIFLGLFLLIIGLLQLFQESSLQIIVETLTILVGGLLMFIGLRGMKRNSPREKSIGGLFKLNVKFWHRFIQVVYQFMFF
jgi:hypothetical protein